MKIKFIYLGIATLTVIAAIIFSGIDRSNGELRYLQHKEELPKEEKPEKDLATHLPIVSIDTGGKDIWWTSVHGELYNGNNEVLSDKSEAEILASTNRECTVQIRSTEGEWHTLSDIPDVEEEASIRVRGNSSRLFMKKSYLLRFSEKDNKSNAVSVMGMPKAEEWVLNGPFLDRTLVRNYLSYNVAGQIMDYAPNVRFCEVFLNEEYKGVYLMVEPVTRDEGRVDLTKPARNQDITSWLVRWDRDGKGDTPIDNFSYYTHQAGVSALDVRYPGKNTITQGRLEYVERDISKIERAIYSSDLSDPVKGYQAYLDVKAFAQYFIINEFFGNVDAGRFSTFLHKDVRGKVVPVVWDFNNACNNYIDYTYEGDGFTITESPWFGMLIHDKTFTKEVITEYRRLRKTVLSDAYLEKTIDDTILYLGDSIERNYATYGYVFEATKSDGVNYLNPFERNYRSYDEAVEQLKSWIKIRGNWLDKHIDSLQQYSQDSKNVNRIIE